MAYIITKHGSQDNIVANEFICDTKDDLDAISPKEISLGATAIVLEGTAGFEVYMATSKKKWILLGGGASADDEQTSSAGD